MQLINLASPSHNCQILSVTSSQNQILHPPSSILQDTKDTVWISGEGLPQQILLNLQQVQIRYQFISGIAFYLTHDYETNPKTVQIWTAKDRAWVDNGQFVHWDTIQLKKKRGRQMFNISQIPESQRIIKIKIVETFGQYHTYINQVMLLAQPDGQSSQSLLNHQEWNKISMGGIAGNLQSSSPNNKQKLFNSNNNKNNNNKNNNRNSRNINNNNTHNHKQTPMIKNNQHNNNNLKSSAGLNQLSPLDLLKDVDEFQESKNSHGKNNYYYDSYRDQQKYKHQQKPRQKQGQRQRQKQKQKQKQKQRYTNRNLQLQDMQPQQQQQQLQQEDNQDHDHSYERNAAMLAISKNMIVMEDNLEQLNRKVDILQKKIEYTYQNLESNIMRRIQSIIDNKLEKQLEKQLLKKSQASNNDYGNEPRRLRSCKDLTTSRTMNHNKNNNQKNEDNNSQKSKNKNNSKKQKDNNSYGLHKSRQKQRKVMSLVSQLNGKLKQRTILANKLQKRLQAGDGIRIKPKSQYYD